MSLNIGEAREKGNLLTVCLILNTDDGCAGCWIVNHRRKPLSERGNVIWESFHVISLVWYKSLPTKYTSQIGLRGKSLMDNKLHYQSRWHKLFPPIPNRTIPFENSILSGSFSRGITFALLRSLILLMHTLVLIHFFDESQTISMWVIQLFLVVKLFDYGPS